MSPYFTLTAIGKFINKKLMIKRDYTQLLKEFANKNEGREIFVEYGVLDLDGSYSGDLNMYYKTAVLPIVYEQLTKQDQVKIDNLSEIDGYLRLRFMAQKKQGLREQYLLPVSFFDLDDKSKLNAITSISAWLSMQFKVQLPLIKNKTL